MIRPIGTVKKEIRSLGLDTCNPRSTIGVIVRGGTYLDGVVSFPSSRNNASRTLVNSNDKPNDGRGYQCFQGDLGRLWVKTRLESATLKKILSVSWTTGKLPEPLRLAHFLAKLKVQKGNSHEVKDKFAKQPPLWADKFLQFCPKCGTTLLPSKQEKKV